MFLETSAKTAYNVEEAFTNSASNILQNIEKNKSDTDSVIIIIKKERNKTRYK